MSPSSRFHILCGLSFACLGVIIGAFAAHGLKPLLSLKEINNFETGVKYQFYHAFALVTLGLLGAHFPNVEKWAFKVAGFLFFIGIILFSGSLYLISTQLLFNISIPLLGPITPLGGSLLIFGWVFTAWGLIKK